VRAVAARQAGHGVDGVGLAATAVLRHLDPARAVASVGAAGRPPVGLEFFAQPAAATLPFGTYPQMPIWPGVRDLSRPAGVNVRRALFLT
jgi:hypothetical protein